ncbi:MAG: hypothetical protein Q8R48_01325 [Candidatus Omnitrophota bacterium]|nr:hypothetical protein [Candidatus Omnitrophota bacterium]
MEKMNKGNIVAALSIGSSRVSACIARFDASGAASIIGLGKTEGRLMGKKGVLDVDVMSSAIRSSLKMAEVEAGIEATRAFVSISGANIVSEKGRGMIKLGKKGEEISVRHVKSALKVAEAMPLSIEKEIIHSIPQSFAVDGQEGVKNPVGLYGVKLEVEALVIAVDVPFLQTIIKCLNIAGAELEDAVFSGIATARCVFPKEAEPGGIVLIEADTSFTALSIFFDNVLRGVDVYDKNIFQEGALEYLRDATDRMRGTRPVSKIIITGSSFLPEEIIERLETVFRVPSQIGYPRHIKGTAKEINNPAHITSMGLAMYGADKRRAALPVIGSKLGFVSRIAVRLKALFNDYF